MQRELLRAGSPTRRRPWHHRSRINLDAPVLVVSSSDLEPRWFFFRRSCSAGENLTRACSFKGIDLEHEVAEIIEQLSLLAGNNVLRNCIKDGELKQVKGCELVDGAKCSEPEKRCFTTDNHRTSCSSYEIIVISDDEG